LRPFQFLLWESMCINYFFVPLAAAKQRGIDAVNDGLMSHADAVIVACFRAKPGGVDGEVGDSPLPSGERLPAAFASVEVTGSAFEDSVRGKVTSKLYDGPLSA
jgi:hypothetical protein